MLVLLELLIDGTLVSHNGLVVPGFAYANDISLDEMRLGVRTETSYVNQSSVTIEMKPGFGCFRVVKSVKELRPHALPAGSKFPVKVSWALRGTATVDEYPGWTPFGTVNADNRSGVGVFEVISGEKSNFPGTFPSAKSLF
ncbi:hypothetical protein [Boudabousia marimammalium]|uniref:Uncharacterized protein n=1 Tax=Boudabousia marimammalium TaxID=156892 RepID=A0A1Q5PKD9_9ACTO|nr:hypothetical protein [Boudabousia marimammalium]OKL46690.1 hypothetical protein BM477_06975 [Boudabousia marimammalium]